LAGDFGVSKVTSDQLERRVLLLFLYDCFRKPDVHQASVFYVVSLHGIQRVLSVDAPHAAQIGEGANLELLTGEIDQTLFAPRLPPEPQRIKGRNGSQA